MYEPGSGNCKARVGLLVLRDCNRPASASCSGCGLPICEKHQIQSASGTVCPECAAENPEMASHSQISRVRRRRGYYHDYGYYPYYYGHHGHYYHDNDYRSVDERGPGPDEAGSQSALAEQGGQGIEDSELAEFDDLES